MDEVDIKRAEIVAIIKEKYEKKVEKIIIEPKVWVKEKIDTTDIKIEKAIKLEVKPKKDDTKPQTTLF